MTELSKEQIINKVRGSMIGGAVGDALGYQIEFDRGVKPKQVTRFRDNHGIISDDTQMTLFTACGLLWRKTRHHLRGIAISPAEAIYYAYLDWLGTQQRVSEHNSISWIKDIPELNVLRAPGMTCLSALSSGLQGTLEEPINDSKGCGGVMRIAPIALCTDEDDIGRISAESCAITHGHPLAILSAYVLGLIIHYAFIDYSITDAAKTAIEKMNDWVSKIDDDRYLDEEEYLIDLLNEAIELAKTDIEDQVAIRKLGEGWVAEESVAIAVYCAAKYEDDFESAIVAAANHDGDSDSTAAIAGNIIGAKLGYDKIPDYYKDNIELKDVILELSDDLANAVPVDQNDNPPDEWLDKYVHVKKNSKTSS
jgi:ADP-ribosylglycohydrolase